LIDKNSLFDGVSIGEFFLCVKRKTTTRCRTISCGLFERKLREGNQGELILQLGQALAHGKI